MTMRLNRKTDYALVALGHLGELAGGSASAREIADGFAMPRALLVNLLKDLHRAGLVSSTRGVNGGYALARPASDITVCEVIEAVEGRFQFALCCPEEAHEGDGEDHCRACDTMGRCPVGHSIRKLSERVEALLHSVTIQDLIDGTVDSPTRPKRRLELAVIPGGIPGGKD